MEPILEAANVSKSFKIPRRIWQRNISFPAITNVSFRLLPGKTVGVIGESGSGKSTLAKLLVGLEKPTHGHIRIKGQDISSAESPLRKETHRRIRAVFQNANLTLNPKLRVNNLLDDALSLNTSLDSFSRLRKVEEVLNLVGLHQGQADNFPHMFSMGEKQRIAIARALILEPDVIVADEPLAHLDMSIQAQIINLLLDIQEKLNISFVIIANDLGVVKHMADDLIVLCSGEVMEDGNTDSMFENPIHPYTKALLNSTPTVVKAKESISKILGKHREKLERAGCPFQFSCPYSSDVCKFKKPEKRAFDKRWVACHHYEKLQ